MAGDLCAPGLHVLTLFGDLWNHIATDIVDVKNPQGKKKTPGTHIFSFVNSIGH